MTRINFCPHCGEGISTFFQRNSCPRCDKECPPQTKFCPHCGFDSQEKTLPVKESPLLPRTFLERDPLHISSYKINLPEKMREDFLTYCESLNLTPSRYLHKKICESIRDGKGFTTEPSFGNGVFVCVRLDPEAMAFVKKNSFSTAGVLRYFVKEALEDRGFPPVEEEEILEEEEVFEEEEEILDEEEEEILEEEEEILNEEEEIPNEEEVEVGVDEDETLKEEFYVKEKFLHLYPWVADMPCKIDRVISTRIPRTLRLLFEDGSLLILPESSLINKSPYSW